MEWVDIKDCPKLKAYYFTDRKPCIKTKHCEMNCYFGANCLEEILFIANNIPNNTRTSVLFNLEVYIISKYTNGAYLVTKVIDI